MSEGSAGAAPLADARRREDERLLALRLIGFLAVAVGYLALSNWRTLGEILSGLPRFLFAMAAVHAALFAWRRRVRDLSGALAIAGMAAAASALSPGLESVALGVAAVVLAFFWSAGSWGLWGLAS